MDKQAENGRTTTTPPQADSRRRERKVRYDRREDVEKYELSENELIAIEIVFPRLLNEMVVGAIEERGKAPEKLTGAKLSRWLHDIFGGLNRLSRIRAKIQFQEGQEKRRKKGMQGASTTPPNVCDASWEMIAYLYRILGPEVISVDKLRRECFDGCGDRVPLASPSPDKD